MITMLSDGLIVPGGPAQRYAASARGGSRGSPTFVTAVKGPEKERTLQVTELPLGPWGRETILDLPGIKEEKPRSPRAVAWPLQPTHTEALFGKNKRIVVGGEEVAYGGNLRGIVQINSEFYGGVTVIGTGVLINGWTVATAGHLLIDEAGHAKNVVILAGKDGSSGDVESRDGIYVTVPYQWYKESFKQEDLGFIHLQKQFDTVNPIMIKQTPVSDNGAIYGYPGDMPDCAKGDYLCKSTSLIMYIPSGMVEHEADTEKGNSGGPILDDKGLVIGLHRGWDYKDDGTKINQAVAIDREGNNFGAFIQVLAYMAKYKGRYCKDNDGEVGGVDSMAEKGGENIKVEVVGGMEKVKGGLAFVW
ncbi:trypsin-like cysteine/serine peptidase domain-containing protein [Leptodontidium sp. MPI-SDFR-AT-0119]|nr:trypsin-like cysteine/serine peptidase domain-containing protein [Leptodontidium sp. MPI-SDFR-AT-0119]